MPSESPAVAAPKQVHKVQKYSLAVFGADLATATIVGIAAAIPISIIDYSIMARVSGVAESSMQELIRGCKTLVMRPHKFFLPCAENRCAPVFNVCVVVYFFTYLTSNSTKSYLESKKYTKDQIYLGAGIVSGMFNTLLTAWKDGIILKILPPKDAAQAALLAKPIPWLSRSMFIFRDTLTCISAFTIAPMVADHWRQHPPAWLPLSADDSSQIFTPAIVQVFSAVIHITGIRYRATYPKFDTADFSKAIRETFWNTAALRVLRIVPAFGLGGILNRQTRTNFLDKAEGLN